MVEFWIKYCIGIVIGVLMTAVKNPESKEQMKARFHDVFQTILMVYPEFANEIVSVVTGPYSLKQTDPDMIVELNKLALKYVDETMEAAQKTG